MATYELKFVNKTSCKIISTENTGERTEWTFMNSSDSRSILQDMLSSDDYATIQSTWGDRWYIPDVPSVDPDVLAELKAAKIDDMNATCHQTIVDGFDAQLSDGSLYHFSLEIEDQLMIQALMLKVKSGQTELLPYHADGQTCKYFAPEDIITIYTKMEQIITYNTTYFNSLRDYINAINNIVALDRIAYGVDIPVEYQSEVLKTILKSE